MAPFHSARPLEEHLGHDREELGWVRRPVRIDVALAIGVHALGQLGVLVTEDARPARVAGA
jgi:hypothetical protein